LNILNNLQLEFGFHNWQHWYVKRNNKWNNAIITFIKFDNSINVSNMISFLRYIRFELVLNDIITNIYIHMNFIYIIIFLIILGCVIIGHKAQGVTISNSNKVIVNIWKCICIRFTYIMLLWVINFKNLFICGNLTSIDFIPMFLNNNFFNTNHVIILFQTQSVLQIYSQYIVHRLKINSCWNIIIKLQ